MNPPESSSTSYAEAVVDDNHNVLPPPTSSDLGPLALAETLQATLVRIMQLGFWRGLVGSLAVFWMLAMATVGCIVGIGVWARRKEERREGDGRRRRRRRRRRVVEDRRGRRRRVRWLDEVEVEGQGDREVEREVELEKMGVR